MTPGCAHSSSSRSSIDPSPPHLTPPESGEARGGKGEEGRSETLDVFAINPTV